jgi:hypothetical protein
MYVCVCMVCVVCDDVHEVVTPTSFALPSTLLRRAILERFRCVVVHFVILLSFLFSLLSPWTEHHSEDACIAYQVVEACLQVADLHTLGKLTVRLLSFAGVLYEKSSRWCAHLLSSLPSAKKSGRNSNHTSEASSSNININAPGSDSSAQAYKQRLAVHLGAYRLSSLLQRWLERERAHLTNTGQLTARGCPLSTHSLGLCVY